MRRPGQLGGDEIKRPLALCAICLIVLLQVLVIGCQRGPATPPKIAFISGSVDNFEIYVMDTDGSNQTRLTDNPDEDLYPAWSPDGSRITFTSDRDGNNEIYVMDAGGSNQIRLTDNPDENWGPAWSP